MKMMKFVLPVIAAGFAASSAQASLTYNVTSDAVTLPGFVINVITVDSTSDLTAVGATSSLTSGTFNQTFSQPSSTVDFSFGAGTDTFLSINGDPSTAASIGGGFNTGGAGAPTFNATLLDVTWSNTLTTDIGTGMHIATLVASVDANGGWNMLATNSGDPGFTRATNLTAFVNGFLVPEPASLALMGLGGLAALRRRR